MPSRDPVKLNVIFLNDTAYVNGGAAKVAIMEANGLAERGHHVTFIACDDGGPTHTRELHPDVRLHCTGQKEILNSNPLTAAVQGIRNDKAIKLINNVLGQCDPTATIVHLHAWSKALSPAVVPALLKHQLPTVCTLHEYFSVCPNGSFYNHTEGAICKLRPMSTACIACNCDSRSYAHKLWRVARTYTQQKWYGMPAHLPHLLTPSHFAKRILTQYLPSNCTVNVLENPVECRRGPPADVASNSRILYVGRISAEKGVRLFLQAAGQIGIRPTVVGDGPDAAALKRDYPEAEFMGWLPTDQTRKVMQSARVLVFPSLWYETDGLVVKEAASIGVPVIASNQSAASETVLDGLTGLHFQCGDAASLAQTIMQILETNEQAADMGITAYTRFWQAPPTVEQHIHELGLYYQRMLGVPVTF